MPYRRRLMQYARIVGLGDGAAGTQRGVRHAWSRWTASVSGCRSQASCRIGAGSCNMLASLHWETEWREHSDAFDTHFQMSRAWWSMPVGRRLAVSVSAHVMRPHHCIARLVQRMDTCARNEALTRMIDMNLVLVGRSSQDWLDCRHTCLGSAGTA